jgi:hypothetical protein
MEVQKDFKDLFALFNDHHVEYIIVGSYALAFHGAPRYTGDIDIFVKPDTSNSKKIIDALTKFGFGTLGLSSSDFEKSDKMIQLGLPPVRVDILTSLTGLSWEKASLGKVNGTYGDIPVHFLGLQELISNKRTLGRKKDLADLEALGEN